MAVAVIDGITTRYEVMGSGPPLLMYAPGGFNATVETWLTQGVYAKIKLLEHLPKKYTCILFDRRECGQSGGRVERVTWAHYVAQGRGLLDHLKIERAHIMGGCMGCCPVAAFGVTHPLATLSMSMSVALRGVSVPHWVAVHDVTGLAPGLYRWPGLTTPTEFRAIAHLPGADKAKIWEPAPQTIYNWGGH